MDDGRASGSRSGSLLAVEPSDGERAVERTGIVRRVGLKALPGAAGKEGPAEGEVLAYDRKVGVQDESLDPTRGQAALD